MSDWWQPLFQTTVDAYYRGDLRAGRDACERLLSVDGLPPEITYQVRRNLVFYAPALAQVAPSARSQPVDVALPEGWTRYNPSIAAAEDGFRMVLRSGNYSVDPHLKYTVHDEDGVVRTKNYLVDLTADLRIAGVREIDDRAVRQDPPLFPVAGFEDCRLVRHRGHWWLSATTRDQNGQGICQIALLRLEGTVVTVMHLLSDGVARHEKNWMPVVDVDDAVLRFVYGCSPTEIVRFDDAAGIVVPETTRQAPLIARDFSGGSQAIPIDDGHLCLIHERAIFEDGGRCYTHRWVWFDAAWRLAKLSLPFIFHDRGVEFAAGLARRGDDLVISYGLWDREARLATVPLAEVLPLLAPPLDAAEIEAEAGVGSLVPVADSAVGTPMTIALSPDAQFTPFPNGRPTLVSTTMTGNSEETIGEALRSVVAWVDRVVLVDTGITDATMEIARDIAGDKLVVREFPWRQDFAAARNFALQAAAETGADWAVHVDSDEWLIPGDLDIRGALEVTTADSLHVMNTDATYGKERFFRLPVRGRYVGPTHEAFIRASGTSQVLDGVQFAEHGKSREQYRRKAERDIEILQRHTAENPTDPRWFYYLGDSLAGIDRREEAIAAFRKCWELKGWDEEGAWAMYRAGKCLLELDRVEEAIEVCAAGMARHAGLAELPWLAAYACWQAGRPAQAAYWAGLSVTMGHFSGSGAMVPRIGFRHPPALWEGPYDVLRFALRALGQDASADEAERLYHEAKAQREAGERG